MVVDVAYPHDVFDHVFGVAFFLAATHAAPERYFRAFHVDLDVARIDARIDGQPIADILQHARVGSLIAARAATPVVRRVPVTVVRTIHAFAVGCACRRCCVAIGGRVPARLAEAARPVVVVPFGETTAAVTVAVGHVPNGVACTIPRPLDRMTVAIGPAAVAVGPRFVEPATARRLFVSEPRPHFISRSFHRPAPVVLAVVIAHVLTVAVIPAFWHAPSSYGDSIHDAPESL